MLELFLKFKQFTIPSDFNYIRDVDNNIYNILLETGKYYVKSNVSEEIFQSFIDHWVNKKIPIINKSNFSEYKKLSKEFDRMNDIIALYKNIYATSQIPSIVDSNTNLKTQANQKNDEYETKITNYHKIIDILFNSDEKYSHSLLQRIKKKLFYYCTTENLTSVELLTQKIVENENGLSFILNKQKKTCIIFESQSKDANIFIPKSIFYEGDEFLITQIYEGAFKKSKNTKKIKFAEDSELTLIGKHAFAYSLLEKITIPSSVIEIGENSFIFCNKLKKVKFQSGSKLQKISKGAFLHSSISDISIPPNITEIGERAFSCSSLRDINIHELFQLTKIGKSAFNKTDLQSVLIPPHVTCIDECTFMDCDNLTRVSFTTDSELKSIEKFAFKNSGIVSIVIPSSVIELKKGWSAEMHYLTNIIVNRNNNNDNTYTYYNDNFILGKSNPFYSDYDVLILAKRNIENVVIPSFIRRIAKYAFDGCKLIQKIEFAENSELISIDKYAFSDIYISSIKIPSSVIQMKNCFIKAYKLNAIEVMPNNRRFLFLDSTFLLKKSTEDAENYDVLLYARKDIKEAVIPSFVRKIGSYAFFFCRNLKTVNFALDSQLVSIGKHAFSDSNLVSIEIPQHVKKIGKFCFSSCNLLRSITFAENCELTRIRKNTFSGSAINHIKISSKVTKIGLCSFNSCSYLKSVEFCKNSELKLIQYKAFPLSSIESLQIPSKVVKLRDNWCMNANKLINVFVDGDNENFVFYDNEFLLGKSNILYDYFDTLLFAKRNIKYAKIPSFIRKIAPFAFGGCLLLHKIEFSEDSQLNTIGQFAFSRCRMFSLSIPSHVNNIGIYAFENCYLLLIIEIAEDSELISINIKFIYLTHAILMVPSTIRNSLFFYI